VTAQKKKFYIRARLRICSTLLAKQLGIKSEHVRLFASAALSTLFSNLIFLPLLSLALFVVYMAHYRFFSYDFFAEGVFGMKLFVLAMVFGLVITTFALFGSGILLYAKNKGSDIPLYVLVGAAALNLLFLALVITSIINPVTRDFALFIILVTVYLAFYFGVFFFARIKSKVLMIVTLFLVTFTMISVSPSSSAKLLGNGLRTFGVGGEIPIEVFSDDGVVTGKLILLTPEFVYFKEELTGQLSTQALDKVKKIRHVVQPKK
jgi:hypothetical protein